MVRFINKVNRSLSGILLSTAVLLLLLPAAANAVDYFVFGRVYSARFLDEGEEVPSNPLSGVPEEQIVGENLVAQEPRNLVKVKVIKATDGSELGSFITRHDGGYLISFDAPTGGISVEFIIEELATSKMLLSSDTLTLSHFPTFNIRFLLVPEAVAEISDERQFAPDPPLPAKYTAIFTRVGKIEVATEIGGVTEHLIDPTTGLANVDPSVANQLYIPAYEDAPFGGYLYIFGAFSQSLYYLFPSVHYRIHVQNLDDPSDHWYMNDTLEKTKYTVSFSTGTVKTERVKLGPKTESGIPNCYKLTPIAESDTVFWSFPDLVCLWPTGQFNDKYRLTLEIVGLSNPADFAAITHFTDLTLRLDNIAPVAKINPLETGYDDGPRVYTPGLPVPGNDLLDLTSPLGAFPGDYGGTVDHTCLILNLEGPVGSKYLAFKLTAYHSNGFLLNWHFRYERNDNNNEILIGKKYDGSTNTMVDFPGARISSTKTSVTGFQDKYLYLNTDYLEPSSSNLGSCAYRFVIGARTRTTDGYHYLRRRWDQDLHYIQR